MNTVGQQVTKPPPLQILARRDVLAGLMFIVIGALGLWVSRNYPVGTALRMGTGYVPRLLCWMLLILGVIVLVQGIRMPAPPLLGQSLAAWRAVVTVTLSLVAFALSLETLGLVVAILLLVGLGALGASALRPVETLIAAVVLIVLSWAVFILGLGLAIPIWPEW